MWHFQSAVGCLSILPIFSLLFTSIASDSGGILLCWLDPVHQSAALFVDDDGTETGQVDDHPLLHLVNAPLHQNQALRFGHV